MPRGSQSSIEDDGLTSTRVTGLTRSSLGGQVDWEEEARQFQERRAKREKEKSLNARLAATLPAAVAEGREGPDASDVVARVRRTNVELASGEGEIAAMVRDLKERTSLSYCVVRHCFVAGPAAPVPPPTPFHLASEEGPCGKLSKKVNRGFDTEAERQAVVWEMVKSGQLGDVLRSSRTVPAPALRWLWELGVFSNYAWGEHEASSESIQVAACDTLCALLSGAISRQATTEPAAKHAGGCDRDGGAANGPGTAAGVKSEAASGDPSSPPCLVLGWVPSADDFLDALARLGFQPDAEVTVEPDAGDGEDVDGDEVAPQERPAKRAKKTSNGDKSSGKALLVGSPSKPVVTAAHGKDAGPAVPAPRTLLQWLAVLRVCCQQSMLGDSHAPKGASSAGLRPFTTLLSALLHLVADPSAAFVDVRLWDAVRGMLESLPGTLWDRHLGDIAKGLASLFEAPWFLHTVAWQLPFTGTRGRQLASEAAFRCLSKLAGSSANVMFANRGIGHTLEKVQRAHNRGISGQYASSAGLHALLLVANASLAHLTLAQVNADASCKAWKDLLGTMRPTGSDADDDAVKWFVNFLIAKLHHKENAADGFNGAEGEEEEDYDDDDDDDDDDDVHEEDSRYKLI
eukprot:jgi/Mesvir1/12082/Mv00360-RA.1